MLNRLNVYQPLLCVPLRRQETTLHHQIAHLHLSQLHHPETYQSRLGDLE